MAVGGAGSLADAGFKDSVTGAGPENSVENEALVVRDAGPLAGADLEDLVEVESLVMGGANSMIGAGLIVRLLKVGYGVKSMNL